MAAPTETSFETSRPALNSYQTALCVVPPAHICRDIDRLRASHDKAYGRWPAHVNLIYPFVALESLPRAIELIRSKLNSRVGIDQDQGPFPIHFDSSDSFSHRHGSTVFLAPVDFGEALKRFRSLLLEAFGRDAGFAPSSREEIYHPHLTIGQSTADEADYLMSKAFLLLPLEWDVGELVVLVRERPQDQGDASASQMRVWGVIGLNQHGACDIRRSNDSHGKIQTEEEGLDDPDASKAPIAQPEVTYYFYENHDSWAPARPLTSPSSHVKSPSNLTVSSYNVLVDSTFPPAEDRYPLLARTLLSESALADILVLQEVSDSFLSYLLEKDLVRSQWPFATHGAPGQRGNRRVGPLPSLRNIVVLSRWRFRWEWLPFERKHKGAAVLVFEDIGIPRRPATSDAQSSSSKDGADFLPLVLAGVHLTSGLTDSAVAAKKSQLGALVNHLSRAYPENPWIVAGDFNVTTSTVTIDAALRSMSISEETASTISSLETLLSEVRLSDSWFVARAEITDTIGSAPRPMSLEDIHDGEEGATFNPLENPLAAESVGSGLNNRPQRYDRILVKGEDILDVTGFGMFGFPEKGHQGDSEIEGQAPQPRYGSDHWGIRATLKIDPGLKAKWAASTDSQVSLEPTKAPKDLANISSLKFCLAKHAMLPTEDEINSRKEVFTLLKSILRQAPAQAAPTSGDTGGAPLVSAKSNISLVIVPVGSYGLGVWNASSDIDCLCVGSISTKTFFALAGQRLRKAADLGVRILRTVKAASGTMLELEIRGVRLDLQYCPATKIAERWSEITKIPPSDPLFDLPISSLKKLNAYRDMDYLQRTVPDLAAFRLAHRFIKTWAQQRGIYSARFGYLGGIHITLLLSRICKLLFRSAGAVTAADIICTFFNHYANFDWKADIAFDPFFNKQQRPRYQRSATREPAVILSLHAPAINAAHAASLPSVRTLVEELKYADRLLSDVGITWSKLLDGDERQGTITDLPSGAHDFHKSYSSYIKIDVQYWGASLAKGSALVGWLESRCVLLLVDLNRKLPDIHARIWPARFTNKDTTDSDKDPKDYHGCYLIGLAKTEKAGGNAPSAAAESSDRKKLAQGALRQILEQFTERIHGDEKYFDAKTSWVEVSHIKQADLGGLSLDTREWGFFIHEDTEPPSDSDADEPPEELPPGANPAPSPKPRSSSKKLRPAHDILHRILWDPSLDPSDHLIGYIDRFSGTKEMPVERWKTEKTDEEFVPMHRVVYFRRRSDGVRVWDREGRLDAVFGSGGGGG
ncbi:hypothetical protein FGG08_006587 [Glutinoglossum americanum]|uniref:polynucleotide adenylyltransferase n=1 Tax=Glutinoglossum americanum TaxID=1670608 RepID=A0A9P8HW13_9PEZI|nr:hypothetical protein FGG08_006587 [Glutinoglossum americanum]